ncbi:YraN family protein [Saccharicrinis aurantiacus]|uniref:YraN family protein n=1 Tax=Saccharicrinis aurantiacus TaxID=1849719 RepID=UPI000837FC24|nr:YraN family protein [Saccharicrinis aurantiacus]
MAAHNELGNKGEQIAVNFLRKNGYQILEQNWHFKQKEIDIIAIQGDTLIVAEVKTRSTENWEHPSEAINNSKIKFLVDATEAFIEERDIDKEIRFDIISVIPENGEWKIEHIEEAFYPPMN